MKMEPSKSFVADNPVVDLSKPSLRGLSYALRRGSFSFSWNYAYEDYCAVRAARQMWGKGVYPLADAFGVTLEVADGIFCLLHKKLGIDRGRVTPEMVADEIDAILARQEA